MQTQKTNKVGRPSKLTESRMQKLTEALRSGNYRIDACRAVGIHYNTLLTWERKGESQTSREYVEFLESLRRAEAEAVVSNVEVITTAAKGGDWRAAAWFLEHKYPNNWARLDKRASEDFLPDRNKDVIEQRVEKFWAELEARGLSEPTTDDLITELQGRGYDVFELGNIDDRLERWAEMVHKLNSDKEHN